MFWDDRCLDHEPPAGEFEAEWTGGWRSGSPTPTGPRRRDVRRLIEHELVDYRPLEASAGRYWATSTRLSSSPSTDRSTFPVIVFGSSSRNRISRGYSYFAS